MQKLGKHSERSQVTMFLSTLVLVFVGVLHRSARHNMLTLKQQQRAQSGSAASWGVEALPGMGIVTIYVETTAIQEDDPKNPGKKKPLPYPGVLVEYVDSYCAEGGGSCQDEGVLDQVGVVGAAGGSGSGGGPPSNLPKVIIPTAQFLGESKFDREREKYKYVELPANAVYVRFLDVATHKDQNLTFPASTGNGKNELIETQPSLGGFNNEKQPTVRSGDYFYFSTPGTYKLAWGNEAEMWVLQEFDAGCPGIPAAAPIVDCSGFGNCGLLHQECNCYSGYTGVQCDGSTACSAPKMGFTVSNGTVIDQDLEYYSSGACCERCAVNPACVGANYDFIKFQCTLYSAIFGLEEKPGANHSAAEANRTGVAVLSLAGAFSSSFESSSGGQMNSLPSSTPSPASQGSNSPTNSPPVSFSSSGDSDSSDDGSLSKNNRTHSKSTSPPRRLPPSWFEAHWQYLIIALFAIIVLLIVLSCIQRSMEKKRRRGELARAALLSHPGHARYLTESDIYSSGAVAENGSFPSLNERRDSGRRQGSMFSDNGRRRGSMYSNDNGQGPGSKTTSPTTGPRFPFPNRKHQQGLGRFVHSTGSVASLIDIGDDNPVPHLSGEQLNSSRSLYTTPVNQPSSAMQQQPQSPQSPGATAFSGKYKVIKQLGRGAFGSVYLVTQSNSRNQTELQQGANSVLAMKVVRCGTDQEMMTAFNEFKSVKQLQGHPNIVRLVDMFMGWESSMVRRDRHSSSRRTKSGGSASSLTKSPHLHPQQQRLPRSGSSRSVPSGALPGTSLISSGRQSPPFAAAAHQGGNHGLADEDFPHEEADRQPQLPGKSGDSIASFTTSSEDESSEDSSIQSDSDYGGPEGATPDGSVVVEDETGTAGSGGGDYYENRRNLNGTKTPRSAGRRLRGHKGPTSIAGRAKQRRKREKLASQHHQHVDHDASRFVSLVMEYYSEGTLEDGIAKEPRYYSQTVVVLRIFHQLVSALQHSHQHNIVHRDLKPANVLVHSSRERVVVSDFGLAKDLAQSTMEFGGGTLHYLAPEQIEHRVTLKSDVWSIACIIVAMLTGCVGRQVRAMFMLRPRHQFETMLRAEVLVRGPLDQSPEYGGNESFDDCPPPVFTATCPPPAAGRLIAALGATPPPSSVNQVSSNGTSGPCSSSPKVPALPLSQVSDLASGREGGASTPVARCSPVKERKTVSLEKLDATEMPEIAIALLIRMLEPNPSQRPSAEECCTILDQLLE